MNLDLTDDQKLLVESFARLFREESAPARVRAAQPVGFDAGLWSLLAELGALEMRCGDFSLHDAALVMEEAGRWLAPAPLAEAMIATRVLKAVGEAGAELAGQAGEGKLVATIALHEPVAGQKQLVPAGAVADVIVYLEGDSLVALQPGKKLPHVDNLGGMPVAEVDLLAVKGRKNVIAQGIKARRLFAAAREEWKLLTAAALAGLARKALELAAEYASQRTAFGQLIGTFQGVAHPLADRSTDVEGARLLLWRTLRAVADKNERAGALISMTFWWASRAASKAVAQALHTFGGYGLTVEYDVHMYHVRARAWAMMIGDPESELVNVGKRLWDGEETILPEAGDVSVDFSFGPEADALAAEIRQFFNKNLTPELLAKAHFSYDGHDKGIYRALGEAGLLFPAWPEEYGGRGADVYAATATVAVFEEFDWSAHAQGTTNMVGIVVQRFGSPELIAEVMPGLAGGETFSSLGYTEPHCGSDVFAARTTAIRDGDDWVINGQKMFTSGANIADYIFLLARTDPDAPKHKGITMFLVPTKTPGIDIHPIFTFQGERTNATFYADVRLPDRYRIGPVNGGLKVLATALELEQGGASFSAAFFKMFNMVVNWAKETVRNNVPVIKDTFAQARLARTATIIEVAEALNRRSLWETARGASDVPHGPMSKMFTTEAFISESSDLLALVGPEAMVRDKRPISFVDQCYRHSTATSIYGGTSEVMRSMIAEKSLGLPRSRSK